MTEFQPKYLKWRSGRPRWEPGPTLRAAGWRGRDLRDAGGGWLGRDAAAAAAAELNRQVAEWRDRGPAPLRRPKPAPVAVARSVEALITAYRSSPKWARLRASTHKDYASKLRVWSGAFGSRPVAALTTPHLYAWWESLVATRGHAMANGTIAVVRAALSHAVRLGWITINPAKQLGMDGVEPRCVVWTPAECAALVAAADRLGLPSVGDAVIIALHTGQRQGDILAMELQQVASGRAIFRQLKRGARVSVPLTPQLEQRLADIRRRRAGSSVVDLERARRVVLQEDGSDYYRERFGDAWRMVRTAVAADFPEAAGKLFLDLRDTAVTRLALAGCTVPEIRAITGHSMQTIHQVLAHYLALDDRMADSAIDRLKAWMQEEGIAV